MRRQQVQHGGLAAILGGGQHTGGLVEQQIGTAPQGHRFSGHGDGGGGRYLLLGGGGDHTVHPHLSPAHQLLDLPARPAACVGQQLIQSFHRGYLLFPLSIIAYSGRNKNR